LYADSADYTDVDGILHEGQRKTHGGEKINLTQEPRKLGSVSPNT
jgi:hypothetical protein